jgi:hypothetical protein
MSQLVRIPVIRPEDRDAFVGLNWGAEQKTWGEWEALFRGWAEDREQQGYRPGWRRLDVREFQLYLQARSGSPRHPTINLLIDFLNQLP